MNLKAKAAAITAGLIAGTFATAGLVHVVVNYLTTEQITNLIGSVCGAVLVYGIYQVILSRLEYQATLQKIRDSQG